MGRWGAWFSVAFALGVVVPSEVWACTAPLVCRPKTSLTPGAQIPATAVGVPVLLPTPLRPPYQPVVAQLRDASGAALAAETLADALGWSLIAPVGGFAPASTYTLHLPSLCKDPSGAVEPPSDITFTTAALPAPALQPGALQLTALPTAQVSVWTSSGSCTESIFAARAGVDLAAATLAAWRPLLRAEVRVDGEVWSNSAFGDLPLADEAPPYPALGRSVHALHAACGPVPASADGGLAPGPHQVVLRLYLGGSAVAAAERLGDVSLTCPSATDAATGDGDASADGDAAVAADSGSGGAGPPRRSDDGCSAGPGAAGAAGPWMVALAAALGLLRRRRGG